MNATELYSVIPRHISTHSGILYSADLSTNFVKSPSKRCVALTFETYHLIYFVRPLTETLTGVLQSYSADKQEGAILWERLSKCLRGLS